MNDERIEYEVTVTDITPVNLDGKAIGYIVKRGDEWYGYMSKADAEAYRYCVGIGTKRDAMRGIAVIVAEMKAEQAFERRYA
jgi:hypothetical protein